MTSTAQYLTWLREFRFARYCMVCRALARSINCRAFYHFGGARYDWDLERVTFAFERDQD